MTLQHIDLENLTVSPLNVRKYGRKDVADLVASIRAHGLLQPLLVRPVEESSEVVAGQRRLNALRQLADAGGASLVPCMVMAGGDDTAAVEASLAENVERLPMDEVDQYKAFAKLVSEGRNVDDIAAAFGITDRMVRQRLALGNLYSPILTAYRKGEIQASDIRNLTMATPKQQKVWWKLYKDDEAELPTGRWLKMWLFGGDEIPVAHALFDEEASGLAIVSDLFGEASYFADSEAFWAHQNTAIADLATAYETAGWDNVVVMEAGARFHSWDHRSTSKEDGGKVFISVTPQGEVQCHEGFVSNAEANRRAKADAGEATAPKPELTKAAQNYVDLHRHAAVRADLLNDSGTALRLIAAHMICGSDLWSVEAEPQKAAKDEIAAGLEAQTDQVAMAEERAEIASLLDLETDDTTLHARGAWSPRPDICQVFDRLSQLEDGAVLRVLTFLMAESLSVNSPLLDPLAAQLGTDIAKHWQPEALFFDLVRDKVALNAMVGEFAGAAAAREHVTATAKTQRAILTACLDGTRQAANPTWMPRYMTFPQSSYRAQAQNASVPAEAA